MLSFTVNKFSLTKFAEDGAGSGSGGNQHMTSYDPGSLSIPAPEDTVGTPIDSPPIGLPPALFRDGEILAFEYATDPRAIRVLAGFYWRADSRPVGGRVLHDYLESSS